MRDTRSFDRFIGIVTAITGGLVMMVAHSWIRKIIIENRTKSKKNDNRKKTSSTPTDADEYYNIRYAKKQTVLHNGACHCQRIRFRIRAPRVLHAVDIPSKIRFPRVTIPCEYFEPLTAADDGIMSLYAVKIEGDGGIGVHTFCSFCGVHVLYSPTIEPVEVQINADCIDRVNVDRIEISYVALPESYACPISYDPARPFMKRGVGSMLIPSLSSLTYMPPPVSSATAYSTPSGASKIDRNSVQNEHSSTDKYNRINNDYYDDSVDNNYKYDTPSKSNRTISSYDDDARVVNSSHTSPSKYVDQGVITYNNDNIGDDDGNNYNSNNDSIFSTWLNTVVGDADITSVGGRAYNLSSPELVKPISYSTNATNAAARLPLKQDIYNDYMTINTPIHRQLRHHLRNYIQTEEIYD